jgi:hypothetical protein
MGQLVEFSSGSSENSLLQLLRALLVVEQALHRTSLALSLAGSAWA